MPNEAFPRRDLAHHRRSLPLGLLLEHWLSLEESRQTWVSVDRRRIEGLISVKQEGIAWEIDRLLVASDTDPLVIQRILNIITAAASENGIQKLFLRLPAASTLVDVARGAGFLLYTTETLMARRIEWTGAPNAPERFSRSGWVPSGDGLSAPVTIRPKASSDEHGIFQLYSAAVPLSVRQAEAMLLSEWQEHRQRNRPSIHRRECVADRDDRIVGWIQTGVRSGAGQLDTLIHPGHEDCLEPLLEAGFAQLRDRAPILCLVAEHEARLARLLSERGFGAEASFCALVKQLSVRVRQPRLVPVQA